MAEKEMVSAKIAERTKERLDNYAENEGISRSQAIGRMLKQGLDVERADVRVIPVETDGGTIIEDRLDEIQQQQNQRLNEIDQKVNLALEDEPSTLERWISGMSVWVSGLTLAAAIAFTVSTTGLVGGINSDLAFWTTGFGALLMLLFLYMEDLVA